MRTPITVVNSYLHLLTMMPDKITTYLAPLLKEVKHQAALIHDIKVPPFACGCP